MTWVGRTWIALIGASPVMLVILTWAITRQRNQETHILSRGRGRKYVRLVKTVLSLQLGLQFSIFIYALLYKLVGVEEGMFLLVFAMGTLSLFKSLLSVSLVLVNSRSLSSAFLGYHTGILFLLSASIHTSIIFKPRSGLSGREDSASWLYLTAVHGLVALLALSLLLRAISRTFCFNNCSNLGCEQECSCRWRNKTCLSLMMLCVICSDLPFVVTAVWAQFPDYFVIASVRVDEDSALLWAQVVEAVLVVLLLDPFSQCLRTRKKSQIRLVESPSSSYHLSDPRLNGRRGNHAMKFPITNGSLFASLTAVAMSRGNYMGGFDLKSDAELESQEEDSFDKFKTYTKEVDLEETHSVTTIANDDFEFHHHIPAPARTSMERAIRERKLPYRGRAGNESGKLEYPESDHREPHPHLSFNLIESASMNDLDNVHRNCPNNTRLYKKNSKYHSSSNNNHGNVNNSSCNNSRSDNKKIFRRVQSCESLPTAAVLERSYLDNGGYCDHYDEKVVFVTDFI